MTGRQATPPAATNANPFALPHEVCRGAVTIMLFDGIGPSESRIEALIDHLDRGRS